MVLPVIEIEITADPTGAEVGLAKAVKAQRGLEAAAANYTATIKALSRAEKSGILTTANVAKAVAQAENEYKDAAAAAAQYAGATVGVTGGTKKMAGGFSLAGNGSRMLTQQLSQVGQQTMATGHFVQALAIQLPDIGLAFGAVGTAAGLLAGIALPMVIQAFTDADGAAEEFKKALDELKASSISMRDEIELLRSGLASIEALKVTQEIARLTETLVTAENEAAEASGRNKRAAELRAQAIRDEIAALQASLKENEALTNELAIAKKNADLLAKATGTIAGGLTAATSAALRLQDAKGTSQPKLKLSFRAISENASISR